MMLLLSGLTLALAAQAEEYASKPHEVERLPATQSARLEPRRVLGDELALGGHVFAVEAGSKAPRVATEPGAKPSRRLEDGKTVTIGTIELRFERSHDERWLYGNALARRFDLGGAFLYLYDGDLDGRYDGFGADGWAARPGAPVLPLERELLLGDRRWSIASIEPDGSRLAASFETIAGTPTQIATVRTLNTLRTDQGLPPVDLDAELSAGCAAHAVYLERNGWTGRTNPHFEDPRLPGYSDAGNAAGMRSNIMRAKHGRALDTFWRSYYHRIGLMRPGLASIGVSEQDSGIAVIDVAGGFSPATGAGWADPVAVPGDGGVDFPTSFPRGGEMPQEPIPNAGGAGSPLMVVWNDPSAVIEGYEAELWELSGKRRKKVEVATAEVGRYANVRGVLPRNPLGEDTQYLVIHRFEIGGETRTASAVFRTR